MMREMLLNILFFYFGGIKRLLDLIRFNVRCNLNTGNKYKLLIYKYNDYLQKNIFLMNV